MSAVAPWFHEITGPTDPRWPEWKAIYDVSFDVSERVSDAYLHKLLAEITGGTSGNSCFTWMEADDFPGSVAAISLHTVHPAPDVVCLWYLATRANLRSLGLGPAMYAELLRRCAMANARMMLFEVEIPEVAGLRGEKDGEFARRRISWYRRQGAKLLGGVHYVQTVDTGQPPTEMHLMAHNLNPVSPPDVYRAAKEVYGGALKQTGNLTLS
jgi:hypothetical protein